MQVFPKVSVEVITYNQAALLPETLDSILADPYPNFDIVVSDDASTDGTQEVLRDYDARYPGKFVLNFNSTNLGITRNCNRALSLCSGELIAQFAGDDLFIPGKLAAQVKAFEDPEVVLCYHPVEVWDEIANRVMYVTSLGKRSETNSAYDIIGKLGIPGPCSIMVRRSAIPAGGFDERLPTASDWLFAIEVALRGRVVKVDGVYARYRKHGNNIGNKIATYSSDFVRTLDILEERYSDDPQLLRACRLGRSRFAAGEAFRRFADDPVSAQHWLRVAVRGAPWDMRYRIASLVARFRSLRMLAIRSRLLLKRFIA